MPAKPASIESARTAKEHAKKSLAGLVGLAGIGLTRKGVGYAVKVNLSTNDSVSVPDEIDGVPVVVELVGKIKKRPS